MSATPKAPGPGTDRLSLADAIGLLALAAVFGLMIYGLHDLNERLASAFSYLF